MNDVQGLPAKRQWKLRKYNHRPDLVLNHLNRDFSATEMNHKWVTDITYVRTGDGFVCQFAGALEQRKMT